MWASSTGHYLLSSNTSNDSCSINNIARYIDDYIDLVENIPNDLARHISRLHEYNNRYYQLLNQLDRFWESLANGHCYLTATNGHHKLSTASSSSLSSISHKINYPIDGNIVKNNCGSLSVNSNPNSNSKYVCKKDSSSTATSSSLSSSSSSLSSPSSSSPDNNSSSNVTKTTNTATTTTTSTNFNGEEKIFDQKKGLRAIWSLQKCLIEIQEISDEKLFIVQSILDLLDGKARQLDFDHRSITIGNLSNSINSHSSKIGSSIPAVLSNDSSNYKDSNGNSNNSELKNGFRNGDHDSGEIRSTTKDSSAHNGSNTNHIASNSLSSKRSSSRRTMTTTKTSDIANGDLTSNHKRGVKRGSVKGGKDIKRSKSSKDMLAPSPPTLYDSSIIDPDEPTYCSCDQVSYGEMICCDNAQCPIEWFHFACVSLTTKPKGKWYCPNCRGDRSNIPRK